MRFGILGLALILVAAMGYVIAMLPAVADQVGYARPFFGLPSHVHYASYDYWDLYRCGDTVWCKELPSDWKRRFPHCIPRSSLTSPRLVHLLTGVPTLFGPSHPVVALPSELVVPWLFVENGKCYVPYHLTD